MAETATEYRVLEPLLERIGPLLEDIENPDSKLDLSFAIFYAGELCRGDPSPRVSFDSSRKIPCLRETVKSKSAPFRIQIEACRLLDLLYDSRDHNDTSSGNCSD